MGVYVVSGLFDYPSNDTFWFYGIAALWSALIISAVAVCEFSFPSSIYSSLLSIYVIFLEFSAIFINFLAVLGGLQGQAFFYLHWDNMIYWITMLEFLGLFLWMLGYGILIRLPIYNNVCDYSANIYRFINNQALFHHQKGHQKGCKKT